MRGVIPDNQQYNKLIGNLDPDSLAKARGLAYGRQGRDDKKAIIRNAPSAS